MKILTLRDIQQGLSYVMARPELLVRAVVNAARLRCGIPLDGVMWLLEKVTRGRLPPDLSLQPVPPGLRVSATVPVMGAGLQIAAVIYVDQVQLSMESVRIHLRVRDLSIKPPAGSPIASMLAMMDLSKPGDLLGFMPVRPPMIVDAHGDEFVLDLMKLPKLAANPMAHKIVAALSEVLAVRELVTEDDLLVFGFRAMPFGALAALGHLRS